MHIAVAKSSDKAGATPSHSEPAAPRHPVAQLQRAAGNQAVQRAMSGAPLPRELRSSLESYFRTPLDRVRVHNDEASQALADTLGARALTVGQDIHLGSDGARATGSARNELLAHEVVHTLQQGQVGPRAKLKVGAPDDRFEKQADRLAESFAHGGHAEAVDHVGGPVIQRAMHRAHYGQFEDHIYRVRTHDVTGDPVGVEMHLKFHPNANALANVIGLTQAVKNTVQGATSNAGILAVRQANRGPGAGWALDRLAGQPNPLYAARETPRAGGSPTRLQDYPTEPIVPLNPPQHGQRFDGWGRHGSGTMVNGSFVGVAAELYDATFHTPVMPSSEQIFETAALEIGLRSTYFGSVEWGWRTDAAGTMTRIPFTVKSQGVPTANFLTAATIWNPSRADFGYETTAAVTLLDIQPRPGGGTNFIPVANVPAGVQVAPSPTGNAGRVGATQYIEVTYRGDTGFADASNLRPVAVGAETLDLPVPMIHTVTNQAGSTMLRNATAGPTAANTLLLPHGTRVTTTRCMRPTPTLPGHYEGTVVDGRHTGTRGFFDISDLTLERLGTR